MKPISRGGKYTSEELKGGFSVVLFLASYAVGLHLGILILWALGLCHG